MKAKNFTLLVLITCLSIFYVDAQVGVNTTNPGDGSILDVVSTEKGVLIPRVSIADLSTIAPVTIATAGEESLLVYNTNITTGKGFHYWDGSNWIPLRSAEDGDFYETGTSTPPSAITDDVFRTGKVAIGRDATNSKLDVYDTTSSNAVEVEVRGSQSGNVSGVFVDYSKTITNTGSHYAFRSYLRGGSGDGARYGMFNNIQSASASTSVLYGVRNNISTTNTSGTYRLYGQYNQMNDSSTGTHELIGTYNTANTGEGNRTGNYNSMTGSGDGDNTGTVNYVSNSGDGDHTGTSNTITGSGDGTHTGVFNNINNSSGDNYGTRTEIDNTDSGKTSYGTYNWLYDNAGTAYAGWFSVTGTGTNYAAVFDDGLVVVNESGNDNDFRVEGSGDNNLIFADASADMVGIGTATPAYMLDVAGDINTTGTIRKSGTDQHPDYVFETYFDGFSKFNKEYSIKSLEEIKEFLKENKHLPNIQSREDVMKNGWDVTEGVRDNLEKVEELFLHNIDASEKIKKLEKENKDLNNKLNSTLKLIETLNKRLTDIETKEKN